MCRNGQKGTKDRVVTQFSTKLAIVLFAEYLPLLFFLIFFTELRHPFRLLLGSPQMLYGSSQELAEAYADGIAKTRRPLEASIRLGSPSVLRHKESSGIPQNATFSNLFLRMYKKCCGALQRG